MSFADRLNKLRREKKVPSEDLAKILNVDKDLILRWEKGLSEPNTKQLIALAQFFQVSTDYLLGLEKESAINFLTPWIDLSKEKEKEMDDELMEELIELTRNIDLNKK